MTVDTSTSSNHPPTRSEPSADRPTGKDKWHKPKISLPETSYENQRVFKTYPYVTMPLNGYFKFLASHEFAMLKRAESFPFTPSSVELHSDRRTISYQHLQGKTIKQLNAEGEIPEGFFNHLYLCTKELHRYQLVHMDLGNSGNIIALKSGRPSIIDFGSAVYLKHVPAFLRTWMKQKDILGVLKHCPAKLS